jgi:outer membrane receptor protein involved in Fe transport
MRGWLRNTASALDPNPFYGIATPGAAHKGNGGEDLLGRATLVYEPSDRFTATLKVSAGVHKDNGTSGQTLCEPAGGLTKPTVLGAPDPTGECKYDKYYQNSAINPAVIKDWPLARDGKPYTDTWSTLTSLTMDYDLGDLKLTSVTGYFKLKHRQALDFTYSSYGQLYSALGENTRQWSQEFRLASDFDSPVNFTLGGYWEDGKRSSPTSSLLFFAPDPATGRSHSYDNVVGVNSQTLSAFGQVRWQLTEQVELAGGVRYSRDKKSVRLGNTYVNPALAILRPAGDLLAGKFSDSNWSPEATLSWKPNSDTLVYGAFKTGYKAGGFANPALLVAWQGLNDLRFKSETIKGFEVGVKSELLNRTARVELTAYSYKYKNLQVSNFDQSLFQYQIINAPSSRIKGVELAGQWRPLQELTLNAAAAYNKAKYTDFPAFPCYTYQTRASGCTIGGTEATAGGVVTGGRQNLTGRYLSRAPKWALNAGFDFETPVGQGLKIGINADAAYTSSYDAGEDKAPILRQKAYTLLNAGARLSSSDIGWELALIGRNLTNKYYKFAGSGKSQGSAYEYITYTPRTREYRIQGTYRF